ncbi:MAG: hypothetical protein K6E10_01095 [Eubacterium sp.]|nr:hypothetical protein [Eubacterium sp.]
MDEVLQKVENSNYDDLFRKIRDISVYFILFSTAIILIVASIVKFSQVSIVSGITYLIIGLMSLFLIRLYSKGEFDISDEE